MEQTGTHSGDAALAGCEVERQRAEAERIIHQLECLAKDVRDYGQKLHRVSRFTNLGRTALHFADRLDSVAERFETCISARLDNDTISIQEGN